jgi:hypothetical protein
VVLATTTGFNAGVLTIQMSSPGDSADLDTNNSNIVTVNGNIVQGNGGSLEGEDVSKILITGSGSPSQNVTLQGYFDYDVLESVSIVDVSGLSVLGVYEMSGDFIVDTESASDFFVQDEDSSLLVEGDVDIKYNSLVSLSSQDNDFQGSVSVESFGTFLVDENALELGNIRTAGNLFVNAQENITQRVGTSIQDPFIAAFTTQGDINLPSQANDFNEINISANELTLGEKNSLQIGDLVLQNNGRISANGDVTTSFQSKYLLDENLDDSKSRQNPLQAIGGSLADGSFQFDRGEGLKLNTSELQTDYFVEFDVNFEEFTGYTRLLDFKDQASDRGLYLLNGRLNFFSSTGSGVTQLEPGTTHTIGMQRSSGVVTGYVDGKAQFSFSDSNSDATFLNLGFFIDNGTEEDPGFVEEIRFNQRSMIVGGDLNIIADGDINLAANNHTVLGNASLRGTNVDVNIDGDLEIDRLVARGDLNLYSTGEISQTSNGLRVVGEANFFAENSIRLNQLSNNFQGPVSADGDVILLSDANNIELGTIQTPKTARVIAGGFITSASDAVIKAATGDFRAAEIRLGLGQSDTVQLTQIKLESSGRSEVHQNGNIGIGFVSASSLELVATGALRDVAASQISVTHNAKFVAGGVVNLGDTATDSVSIGSVVIQAGTNFLYHENGDVNFIGNSRSRFMSVTAEGDITDGNSSSITVTGRAVLNGESITIGDTNTDQFNAISLSVNAVTDAEVRENSTTLLTGNSEVGGDLTLISEGSLLDSISSFAAVQGHLHLEGTNMLLGDRLTAHLSTRTVSFDVAGNATLQFDSQLVFAGTSRAVNANLFSTTRIGNSNNAKVTIDNLLKLEAPRIVTGQASGDSIRTARLTFNTPGAADMAFDRAVIVAGDNQSNSLRLISTNMISDANTSSIQVNKHARFIGTRIDLGDKATDQFNAGSLSFVTDGIVTIQEDSDSILAAQSRVRTLTMTSTGDIRDTATAETIITNSADFNGIDLIIGELNDDCFDILAGIGGLTTNGTGNVNVKLGC